MRVQANPLGPQPACEVAAQARCQPLRDDQPHRRLTVNVVAEAPELGHGDTDSKAET